MPKLVRFFTKQFLPLLLALIPVLPPVRGETAAEDKEGSKMPPGFELAFEIPAGAKDAYGNAIRKGTDSKTGYPLEIRHRKTGIQLVFIAPGEFMMGSELSAKEVASKYGGEEELFTDEHPRHRVRITRPFYLGKYELTVGSFEKFVKDQKYRTDAETGGGAYGWTGKAWEKTAGRYWKSPGFTQTSDHPVVCVSWNDVKGFCEWAGLALPTEAEWEYACRGGTETVRFWGDENKGAAQYANVGDEKFNRKFKGFLVFEGEDDGYVETAPVGRFKPNPWGLYDMIGNVYEWCQDWYGNYDGGTLTDPDGPKAGDLRVLRGGSWFGFPVCCRAAFRVRPHLTPADVSAGVRVCVRDF